MRDFETNDAFADADSVNGEPADVGPADIELDGLLRTALAARGEPATNVDFAARVLATAASHDVLRIAAPPPARFLSATASAWSGWAAALAVAAVVAFGVWRLMTLNASGSTETTLTSTVSSDNVTLLPIGGAVFLAAVVWAVVRSALDSAEPTPVASLA